MKVLIGLIGSFFVIGVPTLLLMAKKVGISKAVTYGRLGHSGYKAYKKRQNRDNNVGS